MMHLDVAIVHIVIVGINCQIKLPGFLLQNEIKYLQVH